MKIRDIAYFAGGCFWGVEHLFKTQKGVLETEVGYMGGEGEKPSYEVVSKGDTGYKEVIKIVFDPQKTDFKTLAKYFFEIHDPTQANGQGPDIGDQYLSIIYYIDEDQKLIAEKLIDILEDKGYDVVTQILPASKFYPAEDYHQNYYKKTGNQPYCHFFTKRF